jgi:hypothetical protein
MTSRWWWWKVLSVHPSEYMHASAVVFSMNPLPWQEFVGGLNSMLRCAN